MERAVNDSLAREHMPLVERIARSESRKLGSACALEDLRSYAMEGLAEAVKRYDPSRNPSFPSFAVPRIRGAIYDGLRQSGWLPKRLSRQVKFYRQAEDLLRARESEPPPADRVEAVHRLADTLGELVTAYVTSFAASEDDDSSALPADAEFALERKRYITQLMFYIGALPPKQQSVVRGYFFEDRSLVDIAAELGVTKSWTSKILTTALLSLRRSFRDEAPLALEESQPVRR